MRKKVERIRNKRNGPDVGIRFEALEPRLLLSGSWGAGADGPSPDTQASTPGDFSTTTVTLAEGPDTFYSDALFQNQHTLGTGTYVDVLAEAPVLDAFQADNADNVDPEGQSTSNQTPPLTDDPLPNGAESNDNPQQDLMDAAMKRELIFINDNITDYEQLIADLQGGDNNRVIETVVLDADRDGIEQVSEILANRSDLAAVHFITHGSDGQINLGNNWLNSTSLQQNSDAVAGWGNALTENGDMLFYGCNIAAGSNGQTLLDNIAELTGADVTASIDTTGHTDRGGDWDLEFVAGAVETEISVHPESKDDWLHLLAPPTITSDGGGPTANINVAENTTAVTTVTATDPDTGDVPTFSITGGDDTALFDIDSNSGVLTFKAAPDFENPTDNDNNNIYEVEVTTDDGNGGTDTQAISVTVTDAGEFVVTTTADTINAGDGETSLREAMLAADSTVNINGNPDQIQFDIANTDPNYDSGTNSYHIQVTGSMLPFINDSVMIDGTTQNGYDGTPSIDIDGALLSGSDQHGFRTDGGPVTIRGLGIRNFTGAAIDLADGGPHVIQGNYIGTDITGTIAHSNQVGISLYGGADNSLVGGINPGDANLVAFNKTAGVLINGAGGIAILGNSIHDNSGLGIDLVGGIEDGYGVTANDADDSDTGSNSLQNYTEIGIPAVNGSNQATIDGKFTSTPSTTFRIEFFANITADSSGHGEGRWIVGSTSVTTDSSGDASFSASLNPVYVGDYITATATVDLGSGKFGSTSEFSAQVTAVAVSNNVPEIKTSVDAIAYSEQASPIAISPELQLADSDGNAGANPSADFTAEVRITGNFDGNDLLGFTDTVNIHHNLVGNTMTLYVAGGQTATVAEFETALRSVTFYNGSDSPSTLDRTVSIIFNDGIDASNTATKTISVVAVNDAPTVANPIPDQVATEDAPFNFQFAANTFADVDVGDNLTYTSDASGWLNFNAGTRTFTGTPLNADVGTVTVTVTADDGNGGTVSDTFDIVVGNTNDAPVLAAIGNHNVDELTELTFTATATDDDLPANNLSFSLDAASIALGMNIDANTGVFSWTPAEGQDGIHSVTVTVTDNGTGALSDAETFNITVNNVLVVTVPIVQSTNEDVPLVFSTTNGNAITVSDLGASDSAVNMTLSVTNGTLSLGSLAGITFVSGSTDGTSMLDIVGTESAINSALENLTYTPDGEFNGGDTLAIVSGGDTVSDLQGLYSFNAGDGTDDSGNGNNGTVFGATATTDAQRGDVLSFSSGDYVQIPGRFGDPQALTLAAWVNLDAGQTYNYAISLGDVVWLQLDTIVGMQVWTRTDTGNYGHGSFANVAGTGWRHVAATIDVANDQIVTYIDGVQALTFGFSGNAINWAVGVADTYIGQQSTGSNAMVGDLDDVIIYDRALNAGEIAALYAAYPTITDTVDITVASTNDAPVLLTGTVNNLTVNEDSGLTSLGLESVTYGPGGGSDESTQTLTYQVTAIPAATSGDIFLSDGTTRVTTGSYTLADIQGMQFKPADNASGTTAFQFNVYDSGGTANGGVDNISQFILITVNAVNDAPVITSNGGGDTASVNVVENSTAVTTVTATDADLDTVNYSISGGADSALFSIDANSGALTFNSAPNFEAPADAGANNVYDVTVQASDGNGGTDTQAISVTVTDVLELVVTNSNATGTGSLYEAIENANKNAGVTDTIIFNIGGGGPQTITVGAGGLPAITDSVIVDATTQPGYSGTPIIELVGSAAGADVDGIKISAGGSGSRIEGLVINRFTGNYGSGIEIDGATNVTITGNYIGTDVNGTTALGMTAYGAIHLNNADGNTISNNVVSGNDKSGIWLLNSDNNVVQNNLIGTDPSGTMNVSNQGSGIYINSGSTGNLIGGVNDGEGNVIAFNDSEGITFSVSGTANAILRNLFFSNNGLAIDLNDDNIVTLNDSGDGDGGTNNLQNFPVLDSAVTDGSGSVIFTGKLNSNASTIYRIEFFANATEDASGHGEAERFIGAISVTTDAAGDGSFTETLSATVAAGEFITATATVDFGSDTYGDTSEFAANIQAIGTNQAPTITSNGGGDTASVNVAENSTAATTVTATDADLDTVNYSISGGVDAALFSIDANNGALTFNSSPNFEAPADAGANNVYQVTVQASDGNGGTDTQAIGVTVTDALELVVTNTNATGTGSLYEAILNANANVGVTDTITFNIPGGGPHVISLTGALPAITDTVIIDGATDPDYAGDPIIRLDGSSAGAGVNGLTFTSTSDGSEVKGLMITGFNQHGIQVDSGADGITITNNWIGTTGTGSSGVGNGNTGIYIQGADTIIGGTGANEGNVITNNGNEGINVTGVGATGTIIQGNIIGLDPDGASGSGNADVGIALLSGAHNTTIGGSTAAERNIISNNVEGIEINSNNNTVQGNYIGTDITGTLDRGNRSDDGVEIQNGATGNLIGGTGASEGNLISGNAQNGILINGADNNTVEGNLIGTDVTGTLDLGNSGQGIRIESSTGSTIGGATTAARNVISGNNGSGIYDYASTGTTILGNYIGVDVNGTATLGNTVHGISLWSTSSAIIGGSGANDGNVIGGNSGQGILLYGGSGHTMQGNYIGTDTGATLDLGNQQNGIVTSSTPMDTLIGGTDTGEGNIIAYNTLDGVKISSGSRHSIIGNTVYNNGELGIDLAGGTEDGFGVTGNDTDDSDIGANLLQNYPVLSAANTDGGTTITIDGALVSMANTTFRIEFFASTSADASGFGEAESYLGYVDVSTDVAGGAVFSAPLSVSVAVGEFITATATVIEDPGQVGVDDQLAYGSTSEFSAGIIAITNAAPVITSNGGGSTAGINVVENTTAVTTVIATDGDGDTPTFSITGGADAALFDIDTNTGVLTFNSAPNFEAPTDADSNNVYEVTVQASDSKGGVDTQAISINVTDALELVVTNTNATGSGSLYEAIENANKNVGVTDSITFNIGAGGPQTIMVDSAGLPVITDSVILDATTQPGYSGTPLITLDGSATPASSGINGIRIQANDSTVKGFIVINFADEGIEIDGSTGFGDNNIIQNNWVGIDKDGNLAGNAEHGIMISVDAHNNQIGGSGPNEGNVVAGNGFSGIIIRQNSDNNVIEGNIIGLKADGTSVAGNVEHGILISLSSDGNRIGGSASGAGNIISGNTGGDDFSGIYVDGATDATYTTSVTGTVILGNYIGTDITGNIQAGNDIQDTGITISESWGNTIGGTAAGEANVLSGNRLRGLLIVGSTATDNVVSGNFIGTNMDGSAALTNIGPGQQIGVYLYDAPGNTIGGAAAGAGNIISGNITYGVYTWGPNTTGNAIQGNIIGLDASEASAIGNGNASSGGILLSSVSDNLIGGTVAGAANVISGHLGAGVMVGGATAAGNTILANEIYNNGTLGIDLTSDGVTANDVDDVDAGPNDLQNYPVITSADLNGTDLTLSGMLDTDGFNTQYRIEFYGNTAGTEDTTNGEGRIYLGSETVTTDGSGDATFANITFPGVILVAGDFVTATVTRITDPAQVGIDDQLAYGSTSEFAVNVVITQANDAPTMANPIPDQVATEDVPFSFTFAASTFNDLDGDTLTYTSDASGWLSFNAATRTFTGTPLNADVGTVTVTVTADDGNGGTVSDTFDIVVGNSNDAPTVANPIPDQVVTEDTPFSFTFAANTFADIDVGDTLTYTSDASGWLSFNAATRTFTGTPLNADVGTVTVTVTADDGNGGTVSDTFDIVVGNSNDAPTIANPIPDQVATEDTPFSFTFAANSFADIDVGDTLTYTSDAAGWLSFNAATRTFTGTPLNADVGTVTVTVIADDGNGGTVSDTFDIVVGNSNDAPTVANPIPDQVATEDAPFSFTFAANTFADIDVGDTLTYTSDAAGWLSFNAVTRTFSGNPLNADVGTVTVTVTADDGNGGIVSDTFDIVVGSTNDAPTVSNPIPDQVATEDTPFTFTFASNTFADIDVGDTLTYTSDAAGWLSFNAATRTFSGTPLNADVCTVTVTVTADDGNGGTVSDTFDIVISNSNDAPTVANPIADQVATEDTSFTFTFAANTFSDVDAGDTLTYTSDASGWLSFNAATRTFTGTPLNADVGTVTVTITADDGNGGTVSDTFDIVVGNSNDAPTVANPIPDQVATEDVPFSFTFAANTFNDVDTSDTLTYTSDASGWLSFNAGTRTFSGTPLNADVGTVTITVTADDGNGGTVSDTFDIVISNSNDAPTVANPIPDQAATEDTPFTFTFAANTFADIDIGDTLTYTSDASGWLSFNAATRTFSGTPLNADVGTVTVTVTADDGNGGTVSDTSDIVISNSNDAPTVANPIPDQAATEDTPFTFTFAANTFNDVDTSDTLTYTSDALGWLSFNAGTRTFSGTPLNADVGTVTITVTADDGNGGTVSDTFDIVISNSNDAPTVANPIPDQIATEDTPFTFTFAANTFADIDVGDTLTYTSDASGWLSFNAATRTFTGTPLNADVGTVTITVTADDGNGGTVSDTFDIVISNTNDAPIGSVTIDNMTPVEGDTLAVSNSLADADGLSGPISYQWFLDGVAIGGETGTTYTTVQADVGGVITVVASYTDDQGTFESVPSAATAAVANLNNAPTGTVTISGTPVEDQTLTVSDTLADTDGMGTVSYQWQSNGVIIAGATGSSYTLGDADVGTFITVIASYTDGQGTSESVTSAQVGPVANINDAPVIGGSNTGAVTKDVDPDTDGQLEVGGALSISDPDTGESSFQPRTVLGTYGSLTIEAAGSWSYVADNTQAAIQQLGAGERLTDVLSVTTSDGTTHNVTITINGATGSTVVDSPPPIDDGGPDPGPEDDTDPIEPDPEEIPPTDDEVPPPEEIDPQILHQTSGPEAAQSNTAQLRRFGSTMGSRIIGNSYLNATVSPSITARYISALKIEITKGSMESRIAENFISGATVFFSPEIMAQALDHLQRQIDDTLELEENQGQVIIGAAAGFGASVMVGYVLWAFRGTSLLLGALSAMPMWRSFDPLPVLLGRDKELDEEKDEKGVRDLLD